MGAKRGSACNIIFFFWFEGRVREDKDFYFSLPLTK